MGICITPISSLQPEADGSRLIPRALLGIPDTKWDPCCSINCQPGPRTPWCGRCSTNDSRFFQMNCRLGGNASRDGRFVMRFCRPFGTLKSLPHGAVPFAWHGCSNSYEDPGL